MKCTTENRAIGSDVLFGFLYAWIVDRDPAARTALRRYCEYICFQGAPGFVSEVIDALVHKDSLGAEAWIRQTEAQYVQDKQAMLRYIFGIKKNVSKLDTRKENTANA